MKTNILFACLILMLSTYDACAAAHDSSWCPCCSRRTRAPQLQQDITPQIPVAALAPAPQAASAAVDPQVAAAEAEASAARGQAALDSWNVGFLSYVVGPKGLQKIAGVSDKAAEKQKAATARWAERTAVVTEKVAAGAEQFIDSAMPVAEALGTRLVNTLAPKVEESATVVADQLSRNAAAWLDGVTSSITAPLPKQRTTYQRFCDDVMPTLLVWGAIGGGATVAGRYLYYWIMGPQKTE